jgi:NAD-dependent deacetylase
MAVAAREPTPDHRALARLQRAGAVSALITQAVDRLHARAGSTDVVEVYGTLLTERCERCGERYGLPEVGALIAAAADGVPRCTTAGCAYPLRPEGTLWGEPLPRAAVERAWELAALADAFVVLDSDLRTAPISLLPSVPLTRGAPLLVVGATPTQYDRYARLLVRAPSAGLLSAVADLIAPEA